MPHGVRGDKPVLEAAPQISGRWRVQGSPGSPAQAPRFGGHHSRLRRRSQDSLVPGFQRQVWRNPSYLLLDECRGPDLPVDAIWEEREGRSQRGGPEAGGKTFGGFEAWLIATSARKSSRA